MGIGFFDLGTCDPALYATPAVPIAPLPAGGAAVLGAIATQAPSGVTPTAPALLGAIDYAKAYTNAHAGRTAAVVFVTDGLPNGCNSTIDLAVAAAKDGYDGAAITTYVIGLGSTSALDQIALAGSGNLFHYFAASGDVATKLQAALKQISEAITCSYNVPTPSDGQTLDWNMVNVQAAVGPTAGFDTVKNVPTLKDCGSLGGWYFDKNPDTGATPSKMILCPASCQPLRASEGSRVQIVLGCATQVR